MVNGPSFLSQTNFLTNGLDEAIPERLYSAEMKEKSNPENDISLTVTMTQNDFFENIINISNSYVKLIRVISFLYRFIHNCKTRCAKIKGPLTSQEVSYAENWLIRSLHEKEFPDEMRKLLADIMDMWLKTGKMHARDTENSFATIGDNESDVRIKKSEDDVDLPIRKKRKY
ncbi:uncharacterized protein NPIL_115821 [Nephila pilipes]|uniref:Uncharacterized protein n=1 Tax=Nephila pilipes TaxID=299642 RepID=A0A8X6TXW5_NEPPI|nr:uncharacterized protein NPIL_115821 [Nephila pilipes]